MSIVTYSNASTNATTYKGNDIDTDGDGTVDAADSAASATDATNVTATYKGNDIDTDGDGTVDAADSAANVTATYKGNDIDSDGDGVVDRADVADDADAYDGLAPSAGSSGEFLQTDGTTVSWAGVSGGTSIPSGTIAMWSGSITNIPSGWVLCDGNNGTPNLQDKFVVGAGNSYAADATGGSDSVTLSTSEIPSHVHSGSTSTDDATSVTTTQNADAFGGSSTTDSADPDHIHNYEYYSLSIEVASGSGAFPIGGTTSTGATSNANNSGGDVSHSHGLPNGTHSHGLPDTAHSHSLSVNSAGGDGSHENRPPFHALAYIQKT